MKLSYFDYKPNFGDSINPMIFNKYLPDFFDEKDDELFLGIGSIIGFKEFQQAKKKIIFSSGFAYGKLPKLDSTYDIICVRGPRTAEILGIDKKLAITDGAALISEFNFGEIKKDYDFSFMPHFDSEKWYPLEALCAEVGIHYISPSKDPKEIIKELLASKCLIAEAMHGAIIADALRVPWIPVKMYNQINRFKWQDWGDSLNMNINFNELEPLYTKKYAKYILHNKLNTEKDLFIKPTLELYSIYQKHYLFKKVLRSLERTKLIQPQLSNPNILASKIEHLKERLEYVSSLYRTD